MKRILFYGNCQLGSLSKHIRDSSDKYQILNCTDYGLEKFWADEGLFATWCPENKCNQHKYISKVIEAVQTCDYFVFNHHVKNAAIRHDELSTEFLISKLSRKSVAICLPSFRYSGYHYFTDEINPLLRILYRRGLSAEEIFDYLTTEDNSDMRKDMSIKHKQSVDELKTKDRENQNIYPNYIPMSDFVEFNYQHKLIAYDHSHPSTHYYNELINRLDDYGIKINRQFDEHNILPGSTQIEPYYIKYFREHFPNMECMKKHRCFFDIKFNIKLIQKQLDYLIKNEKTY